MLVKGGFPEEMTLSWAMKDESVVAKQPWEGQASQDEGTKSPMYKKALMAGRDGGMLGSWTKLVELEQSNQRGAWWEKSLERLAGARAGRAWGPFLGLLDFIPRECPQRVLSRGVSKSGLWFEKHPLVAMGRMSREGEPCGLWWGGADRDWEMIHRRIWCVGPCRSWWWRVDVEGEGEERRGPPPTLVRVAIWWSVTSENVDCGAEMTSPLGPPVSSFVPSSLLWGLLSERTQKGASKMRLLPPDSSLGSCLFAMVDGGCRWNGGYLPVTHTWWSLIFIVYKVGTRTHNPEVSMSSLKGDGREGALRLWEAMWVVIRGRWAWGSDISSPTSSFCILLKLTHMCAHTLHVHIRAHTCLLTISSPNTQYRPRSQALPSVKASLPTSLRVFKVKQEVKVN